MVTARLYVWSLVRTATAWPAPVLLPRRPAGLCVCGVRLLTCDRSSRTVSLQQPLLVSRLRWPRPETTTGRATQQRVGASESLGASL